MNHAEKLLPETEKILKKKKIPFHKVETFLIGRGPGSFTGLRVGFATLKGFLVSSQKNCYGALSLDLIAENVKLPEGSFLCVGLDAYREKIYSRLYQRKKESWQPLNEPMTSTLETWIRQFPDEISLVGSAVQRYRSQIETLCHSKRSPSTQNTQDGKLISNHEESKILHFVQDDKGYPRASELIKLFQENSEKIQKLETPQDFVPLYFRLSEPEEKLKT